MKKLVLLFTTVLVLTFIGCSNGEDTSTSIPNENDDPLTPSPIVSDQTPAVSPSISGITPSPIANDPVPTPSNTIVEDTPVTSPTEAAVTATPNKPATTEPSPSPTTVADSQYHIDKSTPVSTVTGHLSAIDDGQIEASCTCWYEDDECIESYEDFEADVGEVTISISGVEATSIIELGGLAWVEVSYTMLIEGPGTKMSRDMYEVVELERFDEDWLIWGIEDKEEDSEYYRESAIQQEFSNVRMAVDMMMRFPDTPIADLDTDPRVASYVNDQSHPTNDMTDGGLITLAPAEFDNGGRVNPVSNYFDQDYTGLYYIVDTTGKVRCFLDENGEEEIQ